MYPAGFNFIFLTFNDFILPAIPSRGSRQITSLFIATVTCDRPISFLRNTYEEGPLTNSGGQEAGRSAQTRQRQFSTTLQMKYNFTAQTTANTE